MGVGLRKETAQLVTVLKFTGGDLPVCDLPRSRRGGGVGMTSALTHSSLLRTKPRGAKRTPSNAKFNMHVTEDFAHKAKGVRGYKEAECQCSSMHWVDCFSVQEPLSSPALSPLFLLPLSLSVEILSSPGHMLWRTIQFCHQGRFQNFDVEMMSFFLLSLIQQLVHKKLFILPKLLPFNYAKPPQKLISGAPQLKSNMSWCFSNCNYLENFHFTSKLFTYLLETYDKRS